MDRFEAARDRHARVVGAMRESGMWEVARPPPEAFESRVPFFGDSMSFEQWLRFVMLPNLEKIIDRRGVLPKSSSLALRARREYEHFSTVPQAAPVVDALARLDALIVMLAAGVTSLRFFEAGREQPPRDQRRYSESFGSKDARFLYWELSLGHPPLGARITLEVEEHWSGPVFTGRHVQHLCETIAGDWRDSWLCHSHGFREPGNWRPGRYRLALNCWDEPVAEGEFVITP